MAWKNDLSITTLFICLLLLSCDNENKQTGSISKDSLNMTAGTAVNGANDIVAYLSNNNDLSIFADLLKTAGLNETLSKPGPFTVFAPTNKAFEKFSASDIEEWKNKRQNQLLNFLSDHIVAGALGTDDLEKIKKITTLAGDRLYVSIKDDGLYVNGKLISGGSFSCENGIVYMVNQPMSSLD